MIKGFKNLILRAPKFKVDTEELMATIRKPYDDVVRGQKTINKIREELGMPEYDPDSDKDGFKCPTCYLAYPMHASWCAKPDHIDLVKGPKVCTCGDCAERLRSVTTTEASVPEMSEEGRLEMNTRRQDQADLVSLILSYRTKASDKDKLRWIKVVMD